MIAGGGADVIVDWMPAALAAREKGVPLVNIAQPFKNSGMELTCRKDDRHQDAEPTSRASTLGVWFFGNEYPFLAWMDKLGIQDRRLAPDGVKVLKQGFNVDPLLQKQADCISTMTYNEYWQVIDAGFKPDRPRRLQLRGPGRRTARGRPLCAWRTSSRTRPSSTRWRVRAASMKGWDYARANPDEAAKIVLDNDATGAQTEAIRSR